MFSFIFTRQYSHFHLDLVPAAALVLVLVLAPAAALVSVLASVSASVSASAVASVPVLASGPLFFFLY